ncbi:MAG: AMP-binding protein [Verrucomicrobiales bacterium]|nr:AMP-binding protein [Verrucomicrobiales bacterium]
MNICQGLIECSKLFPEKSALVFGDSRLNYTELEQLSGRASCILRDLGVSRGDRVALVLGNVPAFPVWYYGILRIGAIAVSVNTRLTEEEAGFIISDCDAGIVITTQSGVSYDNCETLTVSGDGQEVNNDILLNQPGLPEGEFLEMEPDDPGIILYTSGTTGFPKGATLSHKNVRSTVHSFNHLCGMTTDDRLLLMVPLFHCYGQNAILNSGLNIGATIILQPVFDLAETKKIIFEQKVTKLFGVPTTFHLMLDSCEPVDIESVTYCFSAAATLAPQLGAAWQEKFGMPVYEGYGLTETAPFASYNHPLKHVPGSIGVPVDLVEMKVVDPETGETCDPETPGEIIVRGPNVMLGYWNRPEETALAVRDGWFYSGDVGKMDRNGYFYIVDRIKDMIAIGGMKVFPSEVERVLLDAPGVKDCAVVGLPEPVLGEEVAVFVVSDSTEPDANAIRNYALANLGQYKVPSKIIFLDELPRNPAGKVLKIELRKLGPEPVAAQAEGDDKADNPTLLTQLTNSHGSSRERMLITHLQNSIQALTNTTAPPAPETGLQEAGMDSLMMVTFATNLQNDLGGDLELPATLVFDYPRIKDLSGYLLNALGLGDAPPAAASDDKDINEMSEEEALLALQKELED